jgi:predicted transcriptional regulator
MSFANVLKFRIPADLQARLDETAAKSARVRSDVAREAVVIGLREIARRAVGDETPPQAA